MPQLREKTLDLLDTGANLLQGAVKVVPVEPPQSAGLKAVSRYKRSVLLGHLPVFFIFGTDETQFQNRQIVERILLGSFVLLQLEETDTTPVVLHRLLGEIPAVVARQGERRVRIGVLPATPFVLEIVQQGFAPVGTVRIGSPGPFELHQPQIHAHLDLLPAVVPIDLAHAQLAGSVVPTP